MKRTQTALAVLALLAMLAGCADFKLGTVLYLPHGQTGMLTVAPPAAASASAVK